MKNSGGEYMEFRYKVLVIDDDSSVSFYIKSVLEAQGYDVIVAENGRDSEIFASSHCPDIILLDLGLPDMDGVAVLKKIREWSAVPGVFHTVNPAANDVYPIYKENAREYTLLKTKQFGTILMMEVGAMMVGKITNLHKNPATVKKGQEKGNFEFGGSTIILLIQPGKVRIDYDLIENTEEGYETIVKMGERIGECRKLKNTKNHYEGTIENT